MTSTTFLQRLTESIQVFRDNNEILDSEMAYFADPLRARKTITQLMEALTQAESDLKHEEAMRLHARGIIIRLEDQEAETVRKKRELESLISHYLTLMHKVESIRAPLAAIVAHGVDDTCVGHEEMLTLASAVQDFFNEAEQQ